MASSNPSSSGNGGGTPLGLGYGLGRPDSRRSDSVASAYFTDDADGTFTDAGTITPGARDAETESQYFSDARSNLPNHSTASLAAPGPPLSQSARSHAMYSQQQQQQAPVVASNVSDGTHTSRGTSDPAFRPPQEEHLAATPAPAPMSEGQTDAAARTEHLQEEQSTGASGHETPRPSIDDATRRAYEIDPLKDAESSSTAEKVGVAEGAAEVLNRQMGTQLPLKAVDGNALESGPTVFNRATVSDDDLPRGQPTFSEKQAPVPSATSSSSSRDRPSETVVDIEKRGSKAGSSDKDAEPVQDVEKGGKRKKGKKAKKEKEIAPEDHPDLAHFTSEQKRIILAQTEMGNKGRTVTYFDIFNFSTKQELAINLMGLIAGAAAGVVQPLMTIVFGNLTTSFTGFANALALGQDPAPFRAQLFSQVNQSSLYLVYIGIGTFLTTYIQIFSWTWTGERTTRRIREAYLRNVLRQNIGFFDKLGPGEVTTRIASDMNMIQSGISDKVPMAVQYISQFIAGLTIAYIKNARIAGVLSVILPCIMFAGGIMGTSESKFKTKMLAFVAEGGTLAEEVISSIRTSRAFGTERKLVELYQIPNAKALYFGRRLALWIAIGLTIMFFAIYGGYALAFYWSSLLVVRGQAASGDVITVIFAVLIGSFSLTMLAPNAQAIAAAVGAANKVFHTIRREPPIDSSSEAGSKPTIEGEIRLENVSLYYPSRPSVKVLDNFSMTFPKGKITALVGQSGSGKSSIISLIMRFYSESPTGGALEGRAAQSQNTGLKDVGPPSDVLGGEIYLDGQRLNDVNVRYLRANIGYVQQEPVLFATTIWENVAYGLVNTVYEHESEEVQRKMVVAACQLANADTFVTNLPEGYDTAIGERGMLLSGGQKQRIAIARAIVSNPPLLLLDEATSALDTTSEVLVQKALDQAATGRTTITIAHRLSTIKEADKIIVMSTGKIVEFGTHNDLLLKPDGAYAALVQAQTLKEQDEASQEADDQYGVGDVRALEEEEAQEAREAEKRGTLKRTGTGKSESSAVLEQQQQAKEEEEKNQREPGIVKLLHRLISSIWEVKLYYCLGAIAAIVSGASYPVFAILLGGLTGVFGAISFDELRSGADRLALYMFIVAIVSSTASFVQTFCFGYTSEYLAQSLRARLFAATLRQDIAYFDEEKNSTGALTSAISDKPQKVNAACGTTLGVILQSLITVVVGCIVALAYAWQIALVGIALIPFTLSAGIIQLKVITAKDEKTRKAHSASAQMACEQTAAIRTVASLTREQGASDTYSISLDEPMRVNNQTAVYANALFAFSQSSLFFILALLFWFGSRQLANGNVSSGHYFVALIATVFGATQAGGVFVFVPDVSSAKSAALTIMRLLDNEVEIDADSKDGKMLEGTRGELVFRNVHFRYPTRPSVRVLRGLDITVKPGQFIALVGPSGCGKSTIIQLAERFYDPITGSVELDGQDLRSLNVKSMRESLALVSQEPTLYDGSIRFNITLGATQEVTEHEIIEACKSANIYDFVLTLPDGLDTVVGGKGSSLSGGQKQRVAIARALIRNPKVLLLDEATSALDSQSEKVVQAALDKAAKNRTTVAVAHRLSTIQGADVIYVLKDGRVAESGNHSELIRKQGIYYELVQQQALEKNA